MAAADNNIDTVLARPSVTRVLATIVRHGPMSRLMVAERTGLTAPSVTKAARLLIDAGYLEDRNEPSQSSNLRLGRPSMLLSLLPGRELFGGINLTGRAVVGAVVDLAGTVQSRVHLDCTSNEVPEVVEVIRTGVAHLRRDLGRQSKRLQSLCLAMSGDVDRRRGVARYSAFLGWHDVEIARLASRSTGLNCLLDNDVHALTVAELWSGAGLDVQTLALITVGDGVGCGLVIDGEIVRGAYDVAGELGHVIVDPSGPLCRCGQRGCVEAYVSEAALVTQLREALGRRVDPEEIASLPDSQPVTEVFTRAGQALGRGVATLASLIGPERIILSPTRPEWFRRLQPSTQQGFTSYAYGNSQRATLAVRPTTEDDWSRGAAIAAIEARFRATPASP